MLSELRLRLDDFRHALLMTGGWRYNFYNSFAVEFIYETLLKCTIDPQRSHQPTTPHQSNFPQVNGLEREAGTLDNVPRLQGVRVEI